MRSLIDLSLSISIPLLVFLHQRVAPYTKVEESFNIQAVHDILVSGIPLTSLEEKFTKSYDHVTFPGAVPRTFVGALLLAGASSPWLSWFNMAQAQALVRGILGIFNSIALVLFQDAVSQSFGSATGRWYLILQITQFHVIYYSSRTLPNMFAFGISTFALRSLLHATSRPRRPDQYVMKHYRRCLFLITFAGVIFRSELAILVAAITLYLIIAKDISVTRIAIPAGLGGLSVGLLFTVPIDSFFWQTFPIWPEWTGFYYNTFLGRASEWGTSPWYYYFVKALPKLILNPLAALVLIPLGMAVPLNRDQALALAIPSFAFVSVYSFLPHKEWRFVIYIIPALTAVAANGASWIWTRRAKSLLYRILSLCLLISIPVSFGLSTSLLLISALNYPGGAALARLHSLVPQRNATVKVHLDNLSCQTGVTRFLQRHSTVDDSSLLLHITTKDTRTKWTYDKTEDVKMLLDPEFWQQFDYVLAERPERVIGSWEILYEQDAFTGISLGRGENSLIAPLYGLAAEELSTFRPLLENLKRMEDTLKAKVTGGRWIGLRMEPKVKVLRKQAF